MFLLLLIKTPVQLDQGPTLPIPFNGNHLFEDSVSKYSHIEGWGLTYEFGEDTVQSIESHVGNLTFCGLSFRL